MWYNSSKNAYLVSVNATILYYHFSNTGLKYFEDCFYIQLNFSISHISFAVPTVLLGYSSNNSARPTFGFTVVQNNGETTSSWTGQCHFCDGAEVLKTTWIRTDEVNHCWEMKSANRYVNMSTGIHRVSQNGFKGIRADISHKKILLLCYLIELVWFFTLCKVWLNTTFSRYIQ